MDNTIIRRNEVLKLFGKPVGEIERDTVIRWQQANKVIIFEKCVIECIYEEFGVILEDVKDVKGFQTQLGYPIVSVVDNYIEYYNNHRYQWGLKKMTPKQYRNHLLNKSA